MKLHESTRTLCRALFSTCMWVVIEYKHFNRAKTEEEWGSSASPVSSHISQKGLTMVCSPSFWGTWVSERWHLSHIPTWGDGGPSTQQRLDKFPGTQGVCTVQLREFKTSASLPTGPRLLRQKKNSPFTAHFGAGLHSCELHPGSAHLSPPTTWSTEVI